MGCLAPQHWCMKARCRALQGTKSSLAQLGRAVDALQARVDAAEEELNVERERHSELVSLP